ncbi:MAG: nuclear transport factor 2 family protein [Thiotrichales bacterium]|nr:nuclear transport factor 2 family protein [Thiotrichales bacterium]
MNQGDFYHRALQTYTKTFEEMTQVNFREKLAVCFSEDARFKDPFNDVKGHESILAVFEHMYATLDSPEFQIQSALLEGDKGYIDWRFFFRIGHDGYSQVIEGMSRVRFDEEGRCKEHIDFWDSGEYVYRKVPLLGWFNNLVAKKLSANQQSKLSD